MTNNMDMELKQNWKYIIDSSLGAIFLLLQILNEYKELQVFAFDYCIFSFKDPINSVKELKKAVIGFKESIDPTDISYFKDLIDDFIWNATYTIYDKNQEKRVFDYRIRCIIFAIYTFRWCLPTM